MKVIKPPRLRRGSTIGIASPSSFSDPFSLAAGLQFLQKRGYKVKLGDCTRRLTKTGFMSASDADRAKELETMFKDPQVDAIFVSVGGYGCMRLLELIDYDVVRDNPKILMGYSDITVLHIAIHQFTGLITVHGPSASHIDQSLGADVQQVKKKNLEWILEKLEKPIAEFELKNPPGGMLLRTIVPGKAKGRLNGGNLDMVESTLGTKFEIDLKDKLFFFEDVHVSEYGVERILTHLLLAKKLQQCSGVVAGDFSDITKSEEPGPSMEEVVNERLGQLHQPSLFGLHCGHGKFHVAVPVGALAEMNSEENKIVVKESIVE